MRNISTEITINAPASKVWDTLMNHANYPKWNPFITSISGSTKQGDIFSVTLQNEGKKPMVFKPTVLVNQSNKEFRWKGKLFVSGIFDGEHYFVLEQISTNETRFIQGENFTGVLSGILLKMIGDDTKAGFMAMNEALKVEVEKELSSKSVLKS